MPKTLMKAITTGTQAGTFDNRLLGGYVIDLLEKCHEIYQNFKRSSDDLEQSRVRIQQMAVNMDTLQTTMTTFTDTVDSIGVHMLQDTAGLSNRQLQIERMKREIVSKKDTIQKLMQAHADQLPQRDKEKRISELRHQRGKLELQLSAVNRDIDTAYEEVFISGERLDKLKELRHEREDEHNKMLATLETKCDNSSEVKHKLLSTDASDDVISMSDMYVSPGDFRRMQYEIEELKRKQLMVDKHIEMQISERAFLKQTAEAIVEKVYDLERKVRKENGDHGYDSAYAQQPCWFQNLGEPGIWSVPASSLAWNQLNRMPGTSQYLAIAGPRDQSELDRNGNQEELVIVEDINNDEGTTV